MRRCATLLGVLGVLLSSAVAYAQPAVECFATPISGDTSGTLPCVQTGDWIIAVNCESISASATPTQGCPTGFSSPTTGNGFNPSQLAQQICYKTATSGDTSASTYVFTPVTGSSGFDTTSLIDLRGGTTSFDKATATAGSSTHPVFGNVPVTLPEDAAIVVVCSEQSSAFSNLSPTPGWSPVYTGGNAGGIQNGGAMYNIFAVATTVPSATVFLSANQKWVSNSFTFGGSASTPSSGHGYVIPIKGQPTPSPKMEWGIMVTQVDYPMVLRISSPDNPIGILVSAY